MSHFNDDWTPEAVLNNYYVLGVVEPEDLYALVKDSSTLRKVLEIITNDYPEIHADLILKNIL